MNVIRFSRVINNVGKLRFKKVEFLRYKYWKSNKPDNLHNAQQMPRCTGLVTLFTPKPLPFDKFATLDLVISTISVYKYKITYLTILAFDTKHAFC